MFWTDDDLNNSPEQRTRMDKACSLIVKSIYLEKNSGIINDYNVNLSKCSCPDFSSRQKPCKHMYRLAHELGLLKLNSLIVVHGLTRDEAKKMIYDKFKENERKLLQEIFYSCLYHQYYLTNQNDPSLKVFFDYEVIRSEYDIDIIANHMTRKELIARAAECSITLKNRRQISEMIAFLKQNHSDMIEQILPKQQVVCISDKFKPHAQSIYNLLCKEFGPMSISIID